MCGFRFPHVPSEEIFFLGSSAPPGCTRSLWQCVGFSRILCIAMVFHWFLVSLWFSTDSFNCCGFREVAYIAVVFTEPVASVKLKKESLQVSSGLPDLSRALCPRFPQDCESSIPLCRARLNVAKIGHSPTLGFSKIAGSHKRSTLYFLRIAKIEARKPDLA